MLLGCSKWGVLLQADNLSLCLDSTLELTGSFSPQESEQTDYFQEKKREIEENNIERHNLKPRWRNFLTAVRCLMTTWSLLLMLGVLADAHRGAQLAGKGLGWAAPGAGAGCPPSFIPPSFFFCSKRKNKGNPEGIQTFWEHQVIVLTFANHSITLMSCGLSCDTRKRCCLGKDSGVKKVLQRKPE